MVKAEWKAAEGIYEVDIQDAQGNIKKDWCNTLINCSGVLNNWKCKITLQRSSGKAHTLKGPDIPGRPSFKGQMTHSAAWDHNTDYSGKKVAIIGIGSSGIQITPEVQKGMLPDREVRTIRWH